VERTSLNFLKSWLSETGRKPLVIRGARQVGKTWLVRHFAKAMGKDLVEINFEKQPLIAKFFDSNDPQNILSELGVYFKKKITPAHSILFLDEIQAVPILLSKLRWFAEDLPELPVIAAGSLLEFVLAKHTFSMPVGRIGYMHLEPLSFGEFLLAQGNEMVLEHLRDYEFNREIALPTHEMLMKNFKEYMLVGGLPATVLSWITDHDFEKVNAIQNDLLGTYRDDFTKYSSRIDPERLDEVMAAVPEMLGQKFVCSRVNPVVPASTIKKVLNLFKKARMCHYVWNSTANGVPLAAGLRKKYFKIVFLDTGLCSTALELNLNKINAAEEVTLINNGAIAEQVVGQLLRTIEPFYKEPALYYWQREEKGSSAEIDYILQHGSHVIPIEVKAGSTGSLKSLHVFMGLKKLPLAVRINSGLPSRTQVEVKDHKGDKVSYELLSIPFYLIGQLHRLIETVS
jgi:uncharacterized protein